MEKLPLVSFVTPSYNQGEFIEETILSIKNQDYPNTEHIIVDGASTDNTLDVIKKYEGTYNMHWISESDNGVNEAINKGFRKAQGEILAFLCADDRYLPWTVSVVAEYFKRHPEVELIYGDMIKINLETGRYRLCIYPQFSVPFLVRMGFLPAPAVFFRKSVVEKVGLFDEGENLRFAADSEYWLRASTKCRVSKVQEVLTIESAHSMSITRQNRERMLRQIRAVRQSCGAPKGIKRYPFKIVERLQHSIAIRFWIAKFAFYYLAKAKKASFRGSLTYPWRNLIEFPGFHIVSWFGFLITMMPWGHRIYKGDWFVLNMERLFPGCRGHAALGDEISVCD